MVTPQRATTRRLARYSRYSMRSVGAELPKSQVKSLAGNDILLAAVYATRLAGESSGLMRSIRRPAQRRHRRIAPRTHGTRVLKPLPIIQRTVNSIHRGGNFMKNKSRIPVI